MPEIKASQFAAEIAKRLNLDTETVRAAALDTCLWGEREAVRKTNAVGAVDQGLFKVAWTTQGIPQGAELRNDAPYAAVIERGRRPGRPGPPLAPIFAWVNRKLRSEIRGQYRFAKRIAMGLAFGKAGTYTGPLSTKAYRRRRADARRRVQAEFGPEERGVTAGTWAVAMKIRDSIHIRGTKPRFILRDTVREMRPRFKREALRRLRNRKG